MPRFARNVAILLVSTSRYRRFYPRYYRSFEQYFLPKTSKHFFIFTDRPNLSMFQRGNVSVFPIRHREFPYVTLLRYQYILLASKMLRSFETLVYIDADMRAQSTVSEEEFFGHGKPLFGVMHPSYCNGKQGPFETDSKSRAYLRPNQVKSANYIQGCFWGGDSADALQMIENLANHTNDDLLRGKIAVWHDESHLNWYHVMNSTRFHLFHPGYAYPMGWQLPFPERLSHINENSLKTLGTGVPRI